LAVKRAGRLLLHLTEQETAPLGKFSARNNVRIRFVEQSDFACVFDSNGTMVRSVETGCCPTRPGRTN